MGHAHGELRVRDTGFTQGEHSHGDRLHSLEDGLGHPGLEISIWELMTRDVTETAGSPSMGKSKSVARQGKMQWVNKIICMHAEQCHNKTH